MKNNERTEERALPWVDPVNPMGGTLLDTRAEEKKVIRLFVSGISLVLFNIWEPSCIYSSIHYSFV